MTTTSLDGAARTEDRVAALMADFATCAVANISDSLDRIVGARRLRPFHRGGTMAGRALTVKTAPGDNALVHRALDLVKSGDVVVVDGGGYLHRALIGRNRPSPASAARRDW